MNTQGSNKISDLEKFSKVAKQCRKKRTKSLEKKLKPQNPTDSDVTVNEYKLPVLKDAPYFTPSTINGVISLPGEKQDLFKPIALKVSILGSFSGRKIKSKSGSNNLTMP